MGWCRANPWTRKCACKRDKTGVVDHWWLQRSLKELPGVEATQLAAGAQAQQPPCRAAWVQGLAQSGFCSGRRVLVLPQGSLLLLALALCAMQGRCGRVLNHINGHRPKLLPAAGGRCGQLHLVPKPSATTIMASLVSVGNCSSILPKHCYTTVSCDVFSPLEGNLLTYVITLI